MRPDTIPDREFHEPCEAVRADTIPDHEFGDDLDLSVPEALAHGNTQTRRHIGRVRLVKIVAPRTSRSE